MSEADAALHALARRHGVALGYTTTEGRRRRTPVGTLVAVLAALGEEIERPSDAPTLLARAMARPPLAAPLVAWGGVLPPLAPDNAARGAAMLQSADGDEVALELERRRDGALVAGGLIEHGVYTLSLGEQPGRLVIAAPARLSPPEPRRRWGVFAPTYALVDRRRRLAGDLTSLAHLGWIVTELGASVVATLPLLAELATAEGAAPGQHPYAPLSRRYWNEAYLDPARLPELPELEAPRRRRPHRDERRAKLAAQGSELRPWLDLAVTRLADCGARQKALAEFIARRPDVERYARYRAAIETHGTDVRRWPAAWRRGDVDALGVPAEVVARHVYAQFATGAQLAELATLLRNRGGGLLLDLPVGSSREGYDHWADAADYAPGITIGAPPDGFFTAGQNWGFPAPLPGAGRTEGYRGWRACLAHHFEHAAALRIDHVMGLSRLWWVPEGMPASEGTYVSYPFEELLATVVLEASRHGAHVIGEDLGTVERGLPARLAARGVAGMRVACFDLETNGGPLRPPASVAAYVDTHDTATFAGFATGAGLPPPERPERRRLVAALAARLAAEGKLCDGERWDMLELLDAVLQELGASAAELVVVNLEDLWGELAPQNVPGTTTEHDNFSRRFAMTLEELAVDQPARAVLARLDAAREKAAAG